MPKGYATLGRAAKHLHSGRRYPLSLIRHSKLVSIGYPLKKAPRVRLRA